MFLYNENCHKRCERNPRRSNKNGLLYAKFEVIPVLSKVNSHHSCTHRDVDYQIPFHNSTGTCLPLRFMLKCYCYGTFDCYDPLSIEKSTNTIFEYSKTFKQ